MQAIVRYLLHYGIDSTALYDITVDASELDEDWMYFFQEQAHPALVEACYSVEFQGCRYI